MKKATLLLTLIITNYISFSQTQYNPSDYIKKPVWIQMIDDEHINYFEALKAFEMYWTTHTKPEGESDMDIKQSEKNKKRFSKRELREAREEASMRMKIKKFDWWKNKMEPFVKEDGSIMTPDERKKLTH